MRYTVDGLVIRESDAGENDKRLVLLTPDRGRLNVLAKGARSLKSKYMNTASLFTYGNYEITQRGEHAWLSGASVTESFYGIRNDIERLALASYVVDVVYELSGEADGALDMLRLALNTLFAIANDCKKRALIKAVFEFRSMTMSGYLPDLSACCVCGKTRGGYMYLDVMNGEMKCAECLHTLELKNRMYEDELAGARVLSPLSAGTLAAARYVVEAPLERLLSFTPEDATVSEFARMSETYLLHHLEHDFSSLEFYHNIMKL